MIAEEWDFIDSCIGIVNDVIMTNEFEEMSKCICFCHTELSSLNFWQMKGISNSVMLNSCQEIA